MALSVQTLKHLQSVGLLEEVEESYEADINYLLKTAMERVKITPNWLAQRKHPKSLKRFDHPWSLILLFFTCHLFDCSQLTLPLN